MVCSGMQVKSGEVHRLAIGVLYLMRHGIATPSAVTLAPQPDIFRLLPPQNMLLKHYGVHPKFITETENRIKFCLRAAMA